jgi:hypothetical protein
MRANVDGATGNRDVKAAPADPQAKPGTAPAPRTSPHAAQLYDPAVFGKAGSAKSRCCVKAPARLRARPKRRSSSD